MLLEYMLYSHNTEQLGKLLIETEKLREQLNITMSPANSTDQQLKHHTRRPFSQIEKNYSVHYNNYGSARRPAARSGMLAKLR
jgi:hypothetical protein